jgi:16S rRNA (guanine527-N7)-methyltransferase
VKHLTEAEAGQFVTLLAEAGIQLPGQTRERVLRHIDWVLETNQFVNLTAITDPEAAIRLHGVDSLVALSEVSAAPAGILLDLGTGAGFPGMPLALATNRRAVLLDSVTKKSSVLGEFLQAEGLGGRIEARSGRVEELARERPGSFAVVTARAVAPLASLVELAAPLLVEGGKLVALKARIEPEELASADAAASVTGMKRTSKREFTLPRGGEARTVVVYERAGEAKVALPRRTGAAQKRPLG